MVEDDRKPVLSHEHDAMALTTPQSVSGRVDAQGRLVSADRPLLALQLQAGGIEGGVLAVPKLAAIARLAQNLGVLVSRNVIAASHGNDLDLLVRAKPDHDHVTLEIEGWNTLAQSIARFNTQDTRQAAEWLWECDSHLKLIGIRNHHGRQPLLGLALPQIFSFTSDDDGNFPILQALSSRARFSGQTAELREDGSGVVLSGLPVIDTQGRHMGWRGVAHMTFAQAESAPPAHHLAESTSPVPEIDRALRPPLERIVAQADDILGQKDGSVDQHYVDYATDIAAAGRHLLGLVDDLNEAQNIESADFRIEGDAVDLADVARRAASLLGVRATDRNIRIDAPADDEVLVARGDFRRILQIMVNLVGNAVRYSPPGSVVWVRPEQEGDLAAIVVADQGKGIPAEAHEHIFEKFARLDKNEPGGTGLGLYISRKLARAMGGDISVDSAPGQGARFILTLPTR